MKIKRINTGWTNHATKSFRRTFKIDWGAVSLKPRKGKIVKNQRGFTLTEIMVTVLLIGIMAAFAIPNYDKLVRRAHERDIIDALKMIHTASKTTKAHADGYIPGTLPGIETINKVLLIGIMSQDSIYLYQSHNPQTFSAKGTYKDFTACVYEGDLSKSNPCCDSGDCPTLKHCPFFCSNR